MDRSLPEWLELVHPTVARRLAAAEEVRAHEHLTALAEREELARSLQALLGRVTVLATPTVPMSPPPIADVEDLEAYAAANALTSRATNPVNVCDLCAISLPCGSDGQGLPVGLQLIGGPGEDEHLLAAALCAERELGTAREQLGSAPRAG